jgi:5'-nucleotidase
MMTNRTLRYWNLVLRLLIPQQEPRLLNVNLPLNSKGVKWTRQSVRHYDGKIIPDKDPRGREHFWFTVTPLEKADPGTDRWAVENGWTSITPLRLDLTDESALRIALDLESASPKDAALQSARVESER